MFYVTAIHRNENNNTPLQRKRCFVYCSNRQCVIDWVNENMGDIHEELYNLVVIEHIGEGIHAIPKEEIWFVWDHGTEHWVHREKPGWSEDYISWAIG